MKEPGHPNLLCNSTPERITRASSELDLNVDARGEVELHQRVHRLGRRIHNVQKPLMGADFELLTALLVDVGPAQAP